MTIMEPARGTASRHHGRACRLATGMLGRAFELSTSPRRHLYRPGIVRRRMSLEGGDGMQQHRKSAGICGELDGISRGNAGGEFRKRPRLSSPCHRVREARQGRCPWPSPGQALAPSGGFAPPGPLRGPAPSKRRQRLCNPFVGEAGREGDNCFNQPRCKALCHGRAWPRHPRPLLLPAAKSRVTGPRPAMTQEAATRPN